MRGLGVYTGVWLRAKETEIQRQPMALLLGKDFTLLTYNVARHSLLISRLIE